MTEKQQGMGCFPRLFHTAFALLLATQIGALFPSVFWFTDLLSELAWQHLLAFCAFLCASLWLRKPAIFCGALIGVFVNIWLLSPLYTPPPNHCDDCQEEPLTVVQFNMYYKNSAAHEFVEWVRQRDDVDIAVLHEAQTNSAALENMKQSFPHFTGPLEGYPSGLAVFSRLPITEIEWIAPPQNAPYDRHMVRVLLTTKQHETIQLYATHLIYNLTPTTRRARNASLARMKQRINAADTPHTLLVGDMNISPWHKQLQDVPAKTGLRNAQLGFGYMPTWHTRSLRSLFTGMMIDHMFVSKNVRVQQRYVARDFGSDHLPVVTSLMVQSRKPLAQ